MERLNGKIDAAGPVFNSTGIEKKELDPLVKKCKASLISLNQLLIEHKSPGEPSLNSGELQAIQEKLAALKSSLVMLLTDVTTGSLSRTERIVAELVAGMRTRQNRDTAASMANERDDTEGQRNMWAGYHGRSKAQTERHKQGNKATFAQRIYIGEAEDLIPPISSRHLQLSSAELDYPSTDPQKQSYLPPPKPGQHYPSVTNSVQSGGSHHRSDVDDSEGGIIVSERSREELQASEFACRYGSLQLVPAPGSQSEYGDSKHEVRAENTRKHGSVFIETQKSSERIAPVSNVKAHSTALAPAVFSSVSTPILPLHRDQTSSDSLPDSQKVRSNSGIPASSYHPDRSLNSNPASHTRFLSIPGSRTTGAGSNIEAAPRTTKQYANIRTSFNEGAEIDSISASTTPMSRASSESRTTVSTSESHIILPLGRIGSTAKRDAAKQQFLEAATRAKHSDIKLLLERSQHAYMRSLLDPESIDNALIELLRNEDNRKSRAKAFEIIMKQFSPNLDCRDTERQQTPLIWAILNQHEDIVRLLIEAQASLDVTDGIHMRTPLIWAARNNNESILRALLAKGASVEARDGHLMRTPFSWAVENRAWKSVEVLLKVNRIRQLINAEDIDGKTALDIALKMGNSKMVDKLKPHGARRGTIDISTPSHTEIQP